MAQDSPTSDGAECDRRGISQGLLSPPARFVQGPADFAHQTFFLDVCDPLVEQPYDLAEVLAVLHRLDAAEGLELLGEPLFELVAHGHRFVVVLTDGIVYLLVLVSLQQVLLLGLLLPDDGIRLGYGGLRVLAHHERHGDLVELLQRCGIVGGLGPP